MPRLSAGILLFRQIKSEPEILLVHPGGPFWAKKDDGSWSLPKGEYDENEEPLHAAKREFKEEVGQDAPIGEYILLGEVKYGNKIVKAWAVKGDFDPEKLQCNYFEMQWPPKSGRLKQFPEVDRACWFTPDAAKQKLVAGQVPFVDLFLEKIKHYTAQA